MFRYILIFLLLTACQTQRVYKEHLIPKSEYKYYSIPRALLEPVVITPPPSRKIYVAASYEQRTQILTDYILMLLGQTKALNDRLTAIKVFDEQARLKTTELNKEENKRVKEVISRERK